MTRPRSLLALALGLAVGLLGSIPSMAITPSGFDCGPDDGRERVTPSGYNLAFAAPEGLGVGHDIAGLVGAPYPEHLMAHSSAHFPLRAYLAPHTSGDLRFRITWAGAGDFDLYVYDDDGNELDSSVNFNPLDGNGELAEVSGVEHCADLMVVVNNYAGQQDEQVTLSITFSNPGPSFACEHEDPHPACAGKVEGEAPAPVPDTRTRLYLTGDRPGQASMAPHYVYATGGQGEPPIAGRLATGRPIGGESNHFTHTALGFTTQNRNPFQAHFTTPVAQPTEIKGDVYASVWVSSETLKGVGDNPPGRLYVDLWADAIDAPASEGTLLGHAVVPGPAIGSAPTLISVVLEDLPAITIEEELTLQVASEPVATSGGAQGNPSDAQWTIYYDSVQFPSYVALDLPVGSLPAG